MGSDWVISHTPVVHGTIVALAR